MQVHDESTLAQVGLELQLEDLALFERLLKRRQKRDDEILMEQIQATPEWHDLLVSMAARRALDSARRAQTEE